MPHQTMNTTKLRRAAGLMTGCALVLAACGGGGGGDGDEPVALPETAGASQDGVEGTNVDSESLEGPPTPSTPFTFDASALSATPLAAGVLTLHGEAANGGVPAAPAPDPIIDTCAAIDAATVSAIATANDDFGTPFEFTARSEGATCLFQDDTHLLGVTIQTPDVLGDAYIESRNPFGGEISSRQIGATTMFEEDAVGIVTFFAARAADDDFAVVVTNDGGTGLLAFESEEAGWAEIAETALAGAATAGAPTDSDIQTAGSALAPTDVCSAFDVADLNAAFDATFTERFDRDGTNCGWATADEAIWIRLNALRLGVTVDDYSYLTDAGQGVLNDPFGYGSTGINGDNSFEVQLEITTDRYGLPPLTEDAQGLPGQVDGTSISEQMVRNLLDRLG